MEDLEKISLEGNFNNFHYWASMYLAKIGRGDLKQELSLIHFDLQLGLFPACKPATPEYHREAIRKMSQFLRQELGSGIENKIHEYRNNPRGARC